MLRSQQVAVRSPALPTHLPTRSSSLTVLHPCLPTWATCSWSAQLRQLEFQELIMFLQKPPTSAWGEKDIELVLSRAYMWRASFQGAASHFS